MSLEQLTQSTKYNKNATLTALKMEFSELDVQNT